MKKLKKIMSELMVMITVAMFISTLILVLGLITLGSLNVWKIIFRMLGEPI